MYIITVKTVLETYVDENGKVVYERSNRGVAVKTRDPADFDEHTMNVVHRSIVETLRVLNENH